MVNGQRSDEKDEIEKSYDINIPTTILESPEESDDTEEESENEK